MENEIEALKKTFKPKKAVLNLCGVMIYNIVDGLSKLLCDPLPYLIKVLCEQTRELTHDFLDYV